MLPFTTRSWKKTTRLHRHISSFNYFTNCDRALLFTARRINFTSHGLGAPSTCPHFHSADYLSCDTTVTGGVSTSKPKYPRLYSSKLFRTFSYVTTQKPERPAQFNIENGPNARGRVEVRSLPAVRAPLKNSQRRLFATAATAVSRKKSAKNKATPTPTMPPKSRDEKTIEERYQKKTQLEHILLRPDSYVGSTEATSEKIHVRNKTTGIFEQKQISYVPALYKIFDEILVNAADNFQRDKSMSEVRVWVDVEQNMIRIKNDGATLPVQMHQTHKVYVPEMVFGHLLTSDNYDDSEKKVVGGRNGYGAKLANIFSTKFTIECCDWKTKKLYYQEFLDNMHTKGKPDIQKIGVDSHPSKTSHTIVTFYPDLQKFGMKKLDKDIVALFERRVYDIAGTTNEKVKVYYNDEPIPVKSFKDYVDLYLPGADAASAASSDESGTVKIYEKCGERWEIAMSISDSGQFQQVSFVNSINTLKGGTHVAHVTDQLVETISKKVNKENKSGMDIKPAHIRNHLMVFVNSLIENPAFDSQTKETMKTNQSKFGSVCKISKKFDDLVLKSGVCDLIMQWAKAKEKIDLGRQVKAKNVKRLVGIPKLEDANDAGGKDSEDCTLILTEGDSAKALAVAGLSVVGRDKFGVFPLKGKPLNVREATHQAVMKNEEIQNVMKIIGLDIRDNDRADTKGLRYGSIMIMADQDFDGSHIKGLFLNLLEHWFPNLLKLPGFVREFITPIVKVEKSGVKKSFFTVGEYEAWKQLNNNGKGWNMKYYKGLGTSTSKEAKEYFRNIEDHGMTFDWSEGTGEALDLAFNKKRADDRKDWMMQHVEGEYVDHTQPSVSYKDFIDKEYVLFCKYDIYRMIPNLMDGLKPSQRKVLFSCFKRKLTKDVKVAQLSGYVSEHAAYHHGEVSLQGTIVNMAQDFVGSNNVNLLVPSGQFGTRLQGGKDAASARYIFTRLDPVARKIYHPDDDALLEYQDDDGQKIEPKNYYPIIPMVLCNGAEGIGTGWSTFVPNYNPRDLINCVKAYLTKKPFPKNIEPWYRNFKGEIQMSEEKKAYEVKGTILVSGNTVTIKELPIKKWTQDYKEQLQKMLPAAQDDASKALIQDFREYHTESTVHFVITLNEAQLEKAQDKGLMNYFRLTTSLSCQNLVLWSPEGNIKRYEEALDIVKAFCPVRLEYYHKRKKNLLVKLRRECEILRQKVRFIEMVIEGSLIVAKKKKDKLLAELHEKGFLTKRAINAKYFDEFTSHGVAEQLEEQENEGQAAGAAAGGGHGQGYEYLLSMTLWSLTQEKAAELRGQFEEKEREVNTLEKTAPEEIWTRDLDDLVKTLSELDAKDKILREEEQRLSKTNKKGKALSREDVTRRKNLAAKRRKQEIKKEDVPDSDSEDSPKNAKRKKLDEETIKQVLKTPTKEETQREYIARLQARQKARRIEVQNQGARREAAFLQATQTANRQSVSVSGGGAGAASSSAVMGNGPAPMDVS
ncbi:unnamed protein product [Amoebophrya sp. A120]|nr:unnamed protein product [Amoebophrya sp. A120]|eukprot:GSA120T00014992001.1